MLKNSLFTLLCVLLFSHLQSQYYSPAQLSAIETSNSAQEGNLYLDTINNDFRIGLTNGRLGKLGDNQKLSLDSANKIIRLNRGDSVDLSKTITGPRFYVGKFQISSAGTITITGLPFPPTSLVFTAYANIESDSINADNQVGNNTNTTVNSFNFMRGFAREDAGSINEQVICGGENGSSINDISRYASPNHSIGIRYCNNNGDNLGITSATVTSFNSNGFTLNVDSFTDGLLVIFEAHR